MDWDTTIALAYAAEQLFVAAQALTSDLLPAGEGLRAADGHLRILCDNEEYLPSRIRDRLKRLRESYARDHSLDEPSAQVLARKTMSVLNDIRDVLAGAEQQREAA